VDTVRLGAGRHSHFALIRAAGASRASVVAYVAPAVAVSLGVAFFQEPFTVSTAGGFLLILAGSWVATRRDPAAAAPEESIVSQGRGAEAGVAPKGPSHP
jgi:hypothetical protein